MVTHRSVHFYARLHKINGLPPLGVLGWVRPNTGPVGPEPPLGRTFSRMTTGLLLQNAAFLTAFAGAGLVLLWAPTAHGTRVRRIVENLRCGRFGLVACDWRVLTVGAAVIYGSVAYYDLAKGLYSCAGPSSPSDAFAYLASGRAFLFGGNPFVVPDCGGTTPVPYGLAALILDAIGSLGGPAGIAVIWGVVTIAVLPLTWWVAGPARRYVTATIAASVLYLPLATTQIDGASNLLVPVTILVTLGVARWGGPWAAAVGGFLSTARFPALFPTVSATGAFRRPLLSGILAVAIFAVGTAILYLHYGSSFLDTVFYGSLDRRSFSLNAYGILIRQGWLPASPLITGLQAALTLGLVVVVWLWARTPLGAATITLTGIAILSQFLSFNILCWLLPVALVGHRPRLWLWGIGVVGVANYNLGYRYAGLGLGIWWPFETLDLVLTGLLIVLFVDLWRSDVSRGVTRIEMPEELTPHRT